MRNVHIAVRFALLVLGKTFENKDQLLYYSDLFEKDNILTKQLKEPSIITAIDNEKITKNKNNGNNFGGFSIDFLNKVKKKSTNYKNSTFLENSDHNASYQEFKKNFNIELKNRINHPEGLVFSDEQIQQVLEKDKTLAKQFKAPKMAKALRFYQRDPDAAMKYYVENDRSILNVLINVPRLICSLFLTSDTNLDDEKYKKENLLSKPKVKEWIYHKIHNPDLAMKMITDGDDQELINDINVITVKGYNIFKN